MMQKFSLFTNPYFVLVELSIEEKHQESMFNNRFIFSTKWEGQQGEEINILNLIQTLSKNTSSINTIK